MFEPSITRKVLRYIVLTDEFVVKHWRLSIFPFGFNNSLKKLGGSWFHFNILDFEIRQIWSHTTHTIVFSWYASWRQFVMFLMFSGLTGSGKLSSSSSNSSSSVKYKFFLYWFFDYTTFTYYIFLWRNTMLLIVLWTPVCVWQRSFHLSRFIV
jgi:hypothetical protein